MPPFNPVTSLQNLSLSALAAQVYSSCKRISHLFNFDNKTSKCRRAVQTLQDYLRQKIPPIMWEEVFNSVQKLYHWSKCLDIRIIVFTFLYSNIRMGSLDIGRYSRSLTLSLIQEPLLLINIVEMDLEYAEEDLIADVSRKCVNLEVITLPRFLSDVIMEEVIRSCSKLKEIRCDNYYGDKTPLALQLLADLESINWRVDVELFATLEVTRKLKLLRLHLSHRVHVNPEHLTTALEMCPDLVEIVIDSPRYKHEENSGVILEILAACRPKLINIDLIRFAIRSDSLEKVMSFKGINLTVLKLDFGITNPLPLLENISKKCQHLVSLEIRISSGASEELLTNLVFSHEISFRKLEVLGVCHTGALNTQGISAAYHCMMFAEHLTALKLVLKSNYGHNIDFAAREKLLVQLFSSPCVKHLKYLKLETPTCISLQVAQNVISNCTEITNFEPPTMTEEVFYYLTQFIKKKRNLDFWLGMPEHYYKLFH